MKNSAPSGNSRAPPRAFGAPPPEGLCEGYPPTESWSGNRPLICREASPRAKTTLIFSLLCAIGPSLFALSRPWRPSWVRAVVSARGAGACQRTRVAWKLLCPRTTGRAADAASIHAAQLARCPRVPLRTPPRPAARKRPSVGRRWRRCWCFWGRGPDAWPARCTLACPSFAAGKVPVYCVVAEFVGVFLFQFIGGGADANSISTGRCPRCPAVPCPAPRHVSSDPA